VENVEKHLKRFNLQGFSDFFILWKGCAKSKDKMWTSSHLYSHRDTILSLKLKKMKKVDF